MGYWAQAEIRREQFRMFPPTLEEMIPEDHPARLYEEILSSLDWKEWEAQYDGHIGQPPIHPRIMAMALLYGLNRGIRSSRKLEEACHKRLDFIWLTEGRHIDHSPFAGFRRRFKKELKGLFRQVGRVALRMGYVRLLEVATDGTRLRANSSDHRTAKGETLEKANSRSSRLAALEQQVERALEEVEQNDPREKTLFGEKASSSELPKDLKKLQQRQEKLKKALAEVQSVDAANKKKGRGSRPAKIPVEDSDSRVLANQEGGYAPHYTPVVTVDGAAGFIVDTDVINDNAEAAVQTEAMERIEQNFGERPKTAMGDGAYGTSHNIGKLEQMEVTLLTPMESSQPGDGNPARREDPTQPVPESEREQLPINPQSKCFDRTAFVYAEEKDCYYCPMGRVLSYWHDHKESRATEPLVYRVYRSEDCLACPVAELCQSARTKSRTLNRDVNEPARQRVVERMATEAGQEQYNRRMWIAETPFAYIKAVMEIKRFLLRGREGVRHEWRWICTAYNLAKWVRLIAAARMQAVQGTMATANSC